MISEHICIRDRTFIFLKNLFDTHTEGSTISVVPIFVMRYFPSPYTKLILNVIFYLNMRRNCNSK